MKLVSSIESTLDQVSDWGDLNLVQFNPIKTQVCAFSTKRTAFIASPRFRNTPLSVRPVIGILGIEISCDVQFRGHLEDKAKLASKKLGVLGKACQYFSSAHRLQLYKAQVRPHMEYCSHLWAGAPQYQLTPFDRIQRRAVRVIGDENLTTGLDLLALRRDVGSLCILYRFYHGECSDELFGLVPAAEFCHRTTRRRERYHRHHLDEWRSTTVRFNRHFLPRTVDLWNRLPESVFPFQYDLQIFKRRVYICLKGRQRVCGHPRAVDIYGRRSSLYIR